MLRVLWGGDYSKGKGGEVKLFVLACVLVFSALFLSLLHHDYTELSSPEGVERRIEVAKRALEGIEEELASDPNTLRRNDLLRARERWLRALRYYYSLR